MAIKGGNLLHVGNGQTLVQRLSTGGPGQLNIPQDKIYELGNYKSVATVRDTPDLSFSLESYDTSPEIEALLTNQMTGFTGADGVATAADNTFTSATADFTGTEGMMVIIQGAGTGGDELVTYVDTVTDANTIELVDAAVTSVAVAEFEVAVNGIDLSLAYPLDIASQWKAGRNAEDPFLVIGSVAVPYLLMSQMSYRYGLHDNATKSATLNGDTIFYNPGATFVETAAGSGLAGQTIVTAHAAYQSADPDGRRVLAVTVNDKRLTFGADYTESYGSVTGGAAITTVHLSDTYATTDEFRIIYSSPSTVDYPQSVHADPSVKPGAVRGRDIEIYIGGYDPTDRAGSQQFRATAVQSVQADWQVQLDKDEEFGNYYAVGQDFDVPTVNGNVVVKPRDPADNQRILRQIAGVTDSTKVLGTNSVVPLALDVVIKHPDTGKTMERIHVPDARFVSPGYQGQTQQKLQMTLNFESDSGTLLVYRR